MATESTYVNLGDFTTEQLIVTEHALSRSYSELLAARWEVDQDYIDAVSAALQYFQDELDVRSKLFRLAW